jgi:hypothetical protein
VSEQITEWSESVRRLLDAAGYAAGAGVAEALVPLGIALESSWRDAQALAQALAGVLEFIDRTGARPTWAQDRATLEAARETLRFLTERNDDDAPSSPAQGRGAERPAGGPEGPDGTGAGTGPG